MCCSVTRGPWNVECLEAIGLAASTDGGRAADVSGNKYRQMMRLRDVHFMALFILIYVGTDVTLGGTFSVPVLSVSRSVEETCSHRLDRHICHGVTRRRCIIGIHLIWLLWRYTLLDFSNTL